MDEKEIHLRDYLRIIIKRKGSILTFFVLTMLIVIIATFTATPLYLAGTKVMIERNTAGSLTTSSTYSPYDPEFIETQNQLIMSTAVVDKAVGNLNPDKIYDAFLKKTEDQKSYIQAMAGWIKDQYVSVKKILGIETLFSGSDDAVKKTISEDIPPTKAQILADMIKGGISVTPVENSRILQIGYISDNPALAMKVADAVAQAFIDVLVDMQMEVSGYSINWMSQKAEIQRKKLEESEQELQEYKKQQDIVTIEDKETVLPERLADLSKNMTVSETKRKELLAVYNQVKNVRKEQLETIPAVVANVSLESINQKIIAADQKVSELSKKYGPKHPKMITAKNELEGLKNKKYSELQKVVETIKNEYLLAEENERSLKGLVDQTRFEAERFGDKSIQLGMLQRKVDTNRFLYDALVKKMKERDLTERNQAVNVWIIEKAELPKIPAKPNKKRNILLGIVLGLFGGIGLAFFFEYLDNTVKTPEDIEEKLNLPVISTIDLIKDKHQTVVQPVMRDTSSLIAESFKGMRTSVLLSSADNPPKILLVSSFTPGEGKSSVSASLAMSLAHAGKKILLIDADMRRPVQHKNFNIENSSGLSSFLAGVTAENEIKKENPIENLYLITSGPIPPNPSELLSSKKLKDLLSDIASDYDMIIIDTPPLASVTDPVILSKHVDGVILVTWAGKTTYEMLGKGLKQLREVNAPLTGLVLNRFNAKKSGYYYNYGDYYYSSES